MTSLGNIYIALVEDDEVFDPIVHARTDFLLVNVNVRWAEKDFWAVECEIEAPEGKLIPSNGRTRVFISEVVNGVVTHSFTGRIDGWPIGPVGRTVTLNIMCKPKNAEAVEIAALAGINDDPWWLYSDREDKRTADVVLGARSALLHWGRDEAEPALVDLLQGNGFIDIGDTFIEGSLEFEKPAQPLTKVEVTIKAEWQQSLPLVVDLAAALGDNGYFGTLSSPDWGSFPKRGENIGDWSVFRSSVAPRNPPPETADVSRVFEGAASRSKRLDAAETAPSVQMAFRRLFFDLDLLATSILSANRRETLTFTLNWAGQKITGYEGTTEPLELECRNMRRDVLSGEDPEWQSGVGVLAGQRAKFDGASWICNTPHVTGSSLYADFDKWDPLLFDFSPSGGMAPGIFFGAPAILAGNAPSGEFQQILRNPTPGYHAIRYALLQARAMMVSGMRIIRASFDVAWEDVHTITGRERVRISGDTVPGGQMIGKVVAVEADFIRGVARITIASAPGRGGYEPVAYVPNYAVPGLFTPGILAASVINSYEEQEAQLAAFEYPGNYDLPAVLEGPLRTGFAIELAPTSGIPDLDVTIAMPAFQFDTEMMVEVEP